MNTLQSSYKIYNLSIILLCLQAPRYLIKLKARKRAHFEVDCHGILLLKKKNESVS